MNSAAGAWTISFWALCLTIASVGEGGETRHERDYHGRAAPLDSAEHRKYAPDRQVDLEHLLLEVTPDFTNRTVSGQATWSFKPISRPLRVLRLDAVDLRVASVTGTHPVQHFQSQQDQLEITFAAPIPPGEEARVTIAYSAEPAQGLYFRTPDMGYPPEETHLWTQGEPIEARHWYPCYDFPNEKFTSEILCRVPAGMVVLSNGRLVSQEAEPGSGMVAVRWRQDKPHVNYLICLVAGYFKKIEDTHRDIPLAFYTPPSDIEHAIHSFRDTKDMMAKVRFQPPQPMLWAQLADPEDVIGRLLAIELLATRRDKESVARLKTRLNEDAFYGVRIEASKALRSIHTPEALEALLESTAQADARVRRQVIADLGGFYRAEAFEALRGRLVLEQNPDIVSEALSQLGAYPAGEVREVILPYLRSESFRNRLVDAAVAAIRKQDDPGYLKPLQETLAVRQAELTSAGLALGLDTLAYLARNEEDRDAVRQFLVGFVNHKRRALRLAAIRALGTLSDPKAIPVVETFAEAARGQPEQGAAQRALNELRDARKPGADLRNLRNEVLELQKANRDLRKELDELKKKWSSPTAPPSPAKKTGKSTRVN